MNKNLLVSEMTKNGDTQKTLSEAMGLSLSRFNAKINERNGATLNLPEMNFIVERYRLSCEKAMAIFYPKFFEEKVS